MEPTLFDTPFNKALKSVRKYSPDQQRDENGRWTAGGVARAIAGGAAALGAGVLAVRNPAVVGRIAGNVVGAARRAIAGGPKQYAQGMRAGRRVATRAQAMLGGRTQGLGKPTVVNQWRAQAGLGRGKTMPTSAQMQEASRQAGITAGHAREDLAAATRRLNHARGRLGTWAAGRKRT